MRASSLADGVETRAVSVKLLSLISLVCLPFTNMFRRVRIAKSVDMGRGSMRGLVGCAGGAGVEGIGGSDVMVVGGRVMGFVVGAETSVVGWVVGMLASIEG